jgi:hypothetical protein
MKIVATIVTSLMLTLALVFPAFASDNQQAATVTKTFQLTINGDIPAAAASDAFGVVYVYDTPAGENEIGFIHFCGTLGGSPPKANCSGNGTVYSESVALPSGVVLDFRFYRVEAGGSPMMGPTDDFFEGQETVISDLVNSASYTFGNQVTKTLQLTINGDVPANQTFFVDFMAPDGRIIRTVLFCGSLPRGIPRGDAPFECTGNGTVYTQSVLFDQGTTVNFSFRRYDGSNPAGTPFYEGTETLNSDMTNTAYFNLAGATPDTGAGNNQQPAPIQLPDTGTEGLTGGLMEAIALTGLLLMLGGYSLMRQRRLS